MKTHELTVSRVFPSNHKRKGEQTYFSKKIESALQCVNCNKNCSNCGNDLMSKKIHTIRSNYPLWEKRIKEVQDGKAVLSLRYWSGKPYNSKQVEFARLDKDSGIGIQKLVFGESFIAIPKINEGVISLSELSKNDSLEFDDFLSWFESYDLSEPMAIIHFTDFRY